MFNKRLLIFFVFIVVCFCSIINPLIICFFSKSCKINEFFGSSFKFLDQRYSKMEECELVPRFHKQSACIDKLQSNRSCSSTRLIKQSSNDLALLRNEAEMTQKRLVAFLNNYKKSKQQIVLYIPNTKSLETIEHLLVNRWNGDASRITDFSRATISFPSVHAMYEGLEDLKKLGLIICSVEDHFKNPLTTGYRDINIIFQDFANGHLGEIQLNIHEIIAFKNRLGTPFFHVIRKLSAIPNSEHRKLTDQEQACLEMLVSLSQQGYDTALQNSFQKETCRL